MRLDNNQKEILDVIEQEYSKVNNEIPLILQGMAKR